MQVSSQTEYSPLLPFGLHEMSLPEVNALCVERFPDSRTREQIMDGLKAIVDRIEAVAMAVDIWIDGSFVTEKLNPNDSDVVLKVPAVAYESGSDEQRAILEWINQNLRDKHLCDSYLFFVYPEGDPRADLGKAWHAYWLKQFGTSRGSELKGIAVVKTGMN